VRLKVLLISLFLMSAHAMSSQTVVEIIGGERSSGGKGKDGEYLVIVENVVIRHDGVIIQCDSAIRKIDLGIIEGFGHIYIYQPDTFNLSGGEYLRYTEKTKTAEVTGKNVVLADKEMTLLTTAIQYNTQNQVGYYTNGADILSDSNTLKSRRGYYNRRTNIFNFKDNVKLTSPDYTMESDTLDYYASTRTAYFFGPTKIVSDENTILCNYGWYNTNTEKAEFSRKAVIYSESNTLSADSILYDKKAGTGRGIGNLKLTDSAENVEVYGQNGLHYEKTKITIISNKPMAVKMDQDDTMYVMADTFYFRNDSLKKILQAYYHTSLMQREFQGKCDSLLYDFNDSSISLFHSPILWNEKNQITGDTMFIRMKDKKIQSLRVMERAFLASEVRPGFFNQISGKTMINSFDSNKLKTVLVDGNAEIVYYIRNNETDTAEYTGVNKERCSKLLILMDSGKVSGIRHYGQPEGKIYPLRDFPETEKYLAELAWKIEEKPVLESFLERKKQRVPVQPQAPKKDPKPSAKPKAKKSKKVKKN
jgi:lipopolysaccharide assembly outer membrane protein LptD (OstA)